TWTPHFQSCGEAPLCVVQRRILQRREPRSPGSASIGRWGWSSRHKGTIIREWVRLERVDREGQHAAISDERYQFDEALWSERIARPDEGGIRQTGRFQQLSGHAVDYLLQGVAESRLQAIGQGINHGAIETGS